MRLPAAKNLLLTVASIVIAFAVAEMTLRLIGISYPEFHRLDESRGWAARPGVAGWWTVEGEAYVSNNQAGFRDRDHTIAKPDGVYRIAVLGDSFTEARAIPLDETYWSIAGAHLAECLGGTVEMLNFGVNGYGTAQELITLKNHALAYRPDLVLLAIYMGNDIWNNSRALDGHEDRPYYSLEGGVLTLDDSFRRSARFQTKMAWQDIKHGLVNASRTLQLIKESYYRVKSGSRNSAVPTAPTPGAEDGIYGAPEDDAWRDAWAVTEALIRAVRETARDGGANFHLVTMSNAIQVHPDAARRAAFAKALGVETLDYPDQRLAAFAAAEAIAATVLAPRLRDYAEANNTYLHGFANTIPGAGHWNSRGHALAGEMIAQDLCATLGG